MPIIVEPLKQSALFQGRRFDLVAETLGLGGHCWARDTFIHSQVYIAGQKVDFCMLQMEGRSSAGGYSSSLNSSRHRSCMNARYVLNALLG